MSRAISRLVIWLLLVSAIISQRPSPAQAAGEGASGATLIVVSLDGYRADYLARGHSPVLAALAAEGVHARALRPVWPTLTYPNHYSLMTGLYPDHHGIINNSMHDDAMGDFSPGNRAANVDGRWWDGAEPLWVTAERHGTRSASVFWPGSQAQIRGTRPTYWVAYDPTVTPEARVDQVLTWLDLPLERRPRFITLYFEQVDMAGHHFGPDSTQVTQAIELLDQAIGHLVTGLKSRQLYESTNLVFVSDHGMSATTPERMVLLEQIVNLEHIELINSLVIAGLTARAGYEAEVARALLASHPHLRCWRKDRIPAKYHYGSHRRIPEYVCLADPGWMVSTAVAEAQRPHPLLGEHGYDNDLPEMQALFVARGPGLKQGVSVPKMDNLEVYPLLARLLDLQPLPHDSASSAAEVILRKTR